jgi:diguanylate cyclase (GGDEF)-like protein
MSSSSQADTEQPLDSPSARQLRAGFPRLRFLAPLEQDFRQAYRAQNVGLVRVNLWLALALVLAFAAMQHLLLGAARDPVADLLRYGVILPIVLAGLLLAYSPWYERYFGRAAEVLAPLAGVSVVALELLKARHAAGPVSSPLETSIFPAVVLTTIYMYFLVGLEFYAAIRSALIVLVVYVAGSLYVYPSVEVAVYNALVLGFANVIGATVCYTLERTYRTSFLEARLLAEMAARDGLTGIYNRRMLDEHLQLTWQQAVRDQVQVALLLVDIDHFKAYNDYFGHQAGDECLRQVARTLARAARRPLDCAARYGGEEFAVLLYDAQRASVDEVARIIESGIARLGIRHPASPAGRNLTVSIGAACVLPAPGRSHLGFLQLADEALYEAKDQGRNRVVVKDKEYASLRTGSFRKTAGASG